MFEICTHQLAHCIKCMRNYWHPLSVCLHLGAPFETDLWNFVFFYYLSCDSKTFYPWEHFIQLLLTHVHTRMHVLLQSPFIFRKASVFYECTWHLIRWLMDVQLAQPLCSGCLYNCLCYEKKGETTMTKPSGMFKSDWPLSCLRQYKLMGRVVFLWLRHGEQWRNIQPEQIGSSDCCMSTALTRLTLPGHQLLWAFVEILKKNLCFLTSNLLQSRKFL